MTKLWIGELQSKWIEWGTRKMECPHLMAIPKDIITYGGGCWNIIIPSDPRLLSLYGHTELASGARTVHGWAEWRVGN